MSRGDAKVIAEPSDVIRTNVYDVHPHDWSNLDRVRFLLDKWSDIFEPDITSSLSEHRGGSGRDAEMSKMTRHPSVVELSLCLEKLRALEPALHGHLMAFRCNAEWRQVRSRIKVKLQSGREDTILGWKKERIVPSWISFVKVRKAEDLVMELFRGDVWIPKDLWDGLVKPVSS